MSLSVVDPGIAQVGVAAPKRATFLAECLANRDRRRHVRLAAAVEPGRFSATAPTLEVTVETMDAAGVERGMLFAWHGPAGPMIRNAEMPRARPTQTDSSGSRRST